MDPIPSDSTLSRTIRTFTGLSYAHILKANLNNAPNLFYSPTSIAMALIALHVGSNAHTAYEIEKVLGFAKTDATKLHSETQKFLLSLENSGKNNAANKSANQAALQIANGLAIQNDYAIEDAFLTTLRNQLGSDIMSVNFKSDGESVRGMLNTWVAEHTGQKITDLLPPNVFGPLTRLVILNAVYFKGFWLTSFNENETQEKQFWPISGNTSIPVQMMCQKAKLQYWSNGDDDSGALYSDVVKFSVVSLPYKKIGVQSVEMLIVLPEERDGLKKLEKLLIEKPEALNEILMAFGRNSREQNVIIELPRFSLSENLPLLELLQELGVKVSENDTPDFTRMSAKYGKLLYVETAIHKAIVDVDELGTRAAAATAVVCVQRSGPASNLSVYFTVDHACIFTLYASDASIPLFIGRLAEPNVASCQDKIPQNSSKITRGFLNRTMRKIGSLLKFRSATEK